MIHIYQILDYSSVKILERDQLYKNGLIFSISTLLKNFIGITLLLSN